MTLPTGEGIAENSDVQIESSMLHVEYIDDTSNPVTEACTTMSQKRKSHSNSPDRRKKGRTSGPPENNEIEQTTIVGSRNSRRASARVSLGRSVNEQPIARRTSARRVAETWSPEFLLSNPKSKLASCNLRVLAVKNVKS